MSILMHRRRMALANAKPQPKEEVAEAKPKATKKTAAKSKKED